MFVFCAVRYPALLAQIVLILHLEPWQSGGSTTNCQIMIHIGDALNVINSLACAALTCIRANAISGSKRFSYLVVLPLAAVNPIIFVVSTWSVLQL
ncbi:hypothetical protein C8Q76DRAFT_368811 [Earliella scabrosa]|nr:hypothetical protein C8Q76DRAFT_368811 [Earliella scabrosa]